MPKFVKKIGGILLVAALFITVIPSQVYAGSSSNEVGRYLIRVSCSTTQSNHSVTERNSSTYPSGTAKVYYSQYGYHHSFSYGGN